MISFTVPKKKMEDAAKLLDAVPTRNGIVSSEFIKIRQKNNRLSMYLSSDVFGEAVVKVMKATTQLEKPLYLDRRMLLPFINAGSDFKIPEYEFVVNGKSVVIKHGLRKAQLENNNSASGYETMPDMSKAGQVEITEEWASVANCALLCACADPIAPALNCVHVMPDGKEVKIRASDTKLAFQGVLPQAMFPCKTAIALPLALVDKLNLFSNGICHFTSKWTLLEFPIGRLWQAIKIECKKFPYENIAHYVKDILTNGESVLQIGSQSLVEAGDRIAVYLATVTQDNPVLRLSAGEGKKASHLYSETVGAQFNEIVRLAAVAKRDVRVEWPLMSVLPILRYCKDSGVVKIFEDSSRKTCLKANNIALVVAEKEKSRKKVK